MYAEPQEGPQNQDPDETRMKSKMEIKERRTEHGRRIGTKFEARDEYDRINWASFSLLEVFPHKKKISWMSRFDTTHSKSKFRAVRNEECTDRSEGVCFYVWVRFLKVSFAMW